MSEVENLRKGSIGYKLKFLFKDSIVYGVASAFNSMIYLFIIPVFTRFLSQPDYAAVDALAVLSFIFSLMTIMGQDMATAVYFYDTDKQDEKKQIISEGMLIQFLSIIFITFGLFVSSDYIVNLYLKDLSYVNPYKVMVLSLPFLTILRFSQSFLKWIFYRKEYLIITIGSTISIILLTLLLVMQLDYGVTGFFLAQLIASAFFGILGLYYSRKHYIFPKKFTYTKRLFSFGFSFMIISFLVALYPLVDRYIITSTFGLGVMSVYALGFRLSTMIKLGITGFQAAWSPFALAIQKDENSHATYSKVLLYYTLFLSIVAIGIAAFAEPLILIFGSNKYITAYSVIVPLTFSIIMESFAWITGIGITFEKRPNLNIYCDILGLIVTVSLGLLTVKSYGLVGVAYSVLLGKSVKSIAMTIISYNIHPIHFNFAPPILILSLSFVLSLLFNFTFEYNYLFKICTYSLLISIFIFISYLKLIPDSDKQKILELKRKLLGKLKKA